MLYNLVQHEFVKFASTRASETWELYSILSLIGQCHFSRKEFQKCPKVSLGSLSNSCTTFNWLHTTKLLFIAVRSKRKLSPVQGRQNNSRGYVCTAVKRGWCDANPVARRVVEQQVPILTPQEIEQITTTAETYLGGSCTAAVGMMLYAGIRPHEVARLSWEQVDLEERAIYIQPRHSKTGGARRVTIHQPLQRILQKHRHADGERICPPNWLKHWRELRRAAGWDSPARRWPQDALRHTFASYHLSHFRSFAELQLEIGHRDATLLRTRYVDQRGVRAAKQFWQYEPI